MTGHLTDEQILQFTAGSMPLDEAITCAMHIDHCPLCSGQITMAAPLHQAFASAIDPNCPPDLPSQILAQYRSTPTTPIVELAIGITFLLSAGLVAIFTIEPYQLIGESAAWLAGLQKVTNMLTQDFTYQTWTALILLAVLTLSLIHI